MQIGVVSSASGELQAAGCKLQLHDKLSLELNHGHAGGQTGRDTRLASPPVESVTIFLDASLRLSSSRTGIICQPANVFHIAGARFCRRVLASSA